MPGFELRLKWCEAARVQVKIFRGGGKRGKLSGIVVKAAQKEKGSGETLETNLEKSDIYTHVIFLDWSNFQPDSSLTNYQLVYIQGKKQIP